MSSTKAKDFLIEKGFDGFANHSSVPRWMDEYAQQQERVRSIAFAEWLNSKAYNSYDSNGKNCGWILHDGMDGNIYTTDQLYELYLKQTNQ